MPELEIISGGSGIAACTRVEAAVRRALTQYLAGAEPAPLCLIAPNNTPDAVREEVRALGYPPHTGVLMRTSGSTSGTGKIVALSWDSLIASAHATHQALDGPQVWACELPYHHIAGFQTIVRTVLVDLSGELQTLDNSSGKSPLYARALSLANPEAVANQIADLTKFYLSVVPTQLARILADPQLCAMLSSACFLVGGAFTQETLLEAAKQRGLQIHTSYGMTETCGGCVYDGLPIGDTAIHIDEADGRVHLASSSVALGYCGGHDPHVLADRSPRVHITNDVGVFDGEYLRILGRADDAITTGGLTVHPQLIESAITRTGWTSIVVGVPDETWGEAVVAVIDDTDRPAQSCDITVIRSWVKSELGIGWSPRYVLTLHSLATHWPMTDSGKINRRHVQQLAQEYLAAHI
ncbi:AMP-binding protein [Trueperella sp. LYQ143]|uniref:AMP-binding protein n=1 Tax=unclassified Trueperella TaxID=2630174 RepID=UPI00398382CA